VLRSRFTVPDKTSANAENWEILVKYRNKKNFIGKFITVIRYAIVIILFCSRLAFIFSYFVSQLFQMQYETFAKRFSYSSLVVD